jgi:hypothetical protein
MAPLLLRPFDPSSRGEQFAWRASMYHPTFKSHIPKTMLLQQVANTCCTPLTGWSMCHERSNPPPPALPYDHTHLALIFSTRLNLEGPRKFDVAFASDPLNPQSIQYYSTRTCRALRQCRCSKSSTSTTMAGSTGMLGNVRTFREARAVPA